MRVMIDTNIIISAALFPNGSVSKALYKAMQPPFQPVISDYIVDEVHRKFQEKFPEKVTELEAFFYTTLPAFSLITTPQNIKETESLIRDPKDRPILRAALEIGADLFLTGDKDFLDSSITDPRIISVKDFLAFYE